MSSTSAMWVWLVGLVLWYAIRHPYHRRARKIATTRTERDIEERLLLGLTVLTLLVLPLLHAGSDVFAAFDYAAPAWQGWAGAAVMISFLVLFQRSHADLGRNWSVTLEIREQHARVHAMRHQRMLFTDLERD